MFNLFNGGNFHVCILLVGLPGSGKSTIRRKIIEKFPSCFNFKIVSRDDILEETIKHYGLSYRESFLHKEVQDEVNVRFEEMKRNAVGENVIVDLTNLSREVRAQNLAPYKELSNYWKVAIVCERSMKELLETNEQRSLFGRNIPLDVIMGMVARFEEPTLSEGFNAILSSRDF